MGNKVSENLFDHFYISGMNKYTKRKKAPTRMRTRADGLEKKRQTHYAKRSNIYIMLLVANFANSNANNIFCSFS